MLALLVHFDTGHKEDFNSWIQVLYKTVGSICDSDVERGKRGEEVHSYWVSQGFKTKIFCHIFLPLNHWAHDRGAALCVEASVNLILSLS